MPWSLVQCGSGGGISGVHRSVQVRTYLIAQDIWDIVEATIECPKQEDDEAAFKAWSKKNAMALHVIQI
ncbi:hypothetical protein SO802_009537 [Lithocarpus litseifolius]|uniref:Uncharacterized protein n=1 Tax=Lithocarpus litseifolius TaxID=425828 RepID=A0AAW2DFR2_9ROSI